MTTYANNLPFAVDCPKCRLQYLARGQDIWRRRCECESDRPHKQVRFATHKPVINLLKTFRAGGVFDFPDGSSIPLTELQMATAKRLSEEWANAR